MNTKEENRATPALKIQYFHTVIQNTDRRNRENLVAASIDPPCFAGDNLVKSFACSTLN